MPGEQLEMPERPGMKASAPVLKEKFRIAALIIYPSTNYEIGLL
jgi:hypothetical protein